MTNKDSNEEGKEVYQKNVNQLLNTIDSNFQSKAILPSLILVYSCMDIMAWLGRSESHQDSTRSDFKDWVRTYLLPSSSLGCKVNDLYAARCSIIHSYTSESTLSREGQAKKIFYTSGLASSKVLQKGIDNSIEKGNAIVVHIDTLINALKTAIERFNEGLSKNSSLATLVYNRAKKFYIYIPHRITFGTTL